MNTIYESHRILNQLDAERVTELESEPLEFPMMDVEPDVSDVPLFLKKQAE